MHKLYSGKIKNGGKKELLLDGLDLILRITGADGKVKTIKDERAWALLNEKDIKGGEIERARMHFVENMLESSRSEMAEHTTNVKPINAMLLETIKKFGFVLESGADVDEDGFSHYEYNKHGSTYQVEIESKKDENGKSTSPFGNKYSIFYTLWQLDNEGMYQSIIYTEEEDVIVNELERIGEKNSWKKHFKLTPENITNVFKMEEKKKGVFVRGNIILKVPSLEVLRAKKDKTFKKLFAGGDLEMAYEKLLSVDEKETWYKFAK